MSGGVTPFGEVVSTVEIIAPSPNTHRCQLPEANGHRPGTLARCAICGDVWLSRGEVGWSHWWRLGLYGHWKYRRVLRD